jgi:hypothetical protein
MTVLLAMTHVEPAEQQDQQECLDSSKNSGGTVHAIGPRETDNGLLFIFL